jgi:hypothetical protein
MANMAASYTFEHKTIKAQDAIPKKTVRPIKIRSVIKSLPEFPLYKNPV